jgi:TonB family protein
MLPPAEQLLGYIVGSAVMLTVMAATVAVSTWVFRPRTAHAAWVCWSMAFAALAASLFRWPLERLMGVLWPVERAVAPAPMSIVIGSIDSVVATTQGTPWPAVIVIVFTAGLLVQLSALALGLRRLWRIRGRATAVDLPSDILALQRRMGVRRVRWVTSPDAPGPATFGYRHHIVLLPQVVLDDPGIRQAIACHELWHVKRADWATAFLVELMRVVFWYHPAMWWLANRVDLLREQAVDQAVIRELGERDSYLQALLASASVSVDLPPIGATAWSRRRHLAARVKALMQPPDPWVNPGMEQMKQMLVFVIALQVSSSSLVAFPATPRPQQPDTVYSVGGDVTPPKVVRMVRPDYTTEAMQLGITGEVVVSAVIKDDGSVGDVSVKQSLDDRYGLDDAALAAVRQCVFSPAMRQGKPVAVRVDISMKFTLK